MKTLFRAYDPATGNPWFIELVPPQEVGESEVFAVSEGSIHRGATETFAAAGRLLQQLTEQRVRVPVPQKRENGDYAFTYVCTDGNEDGPRRCMTFEEAETANVAAEAGTGGNWWWALDV